MRWRSYRSVAGWLAAGLLASSAQALDTVSLLSEGPSKTLLEKKKPIIAETRGMVPVAFSNALVVFDAPSLLQDVQEVYCKEIARDAAPEFTIEQSSSNTYYYVNRKGERTDIMEVVRRPTSETAFDIVYYSSGKRFFGHYEAVIHVQITEGAEGESNYAATVYAYPENAVGRFFARYFGLVERFFKSKTEEMTGVITTIACSLCKHAEADSGKETSG